MGFGIGNKVGDKSVTLNDLIKDLDAQKDKKKIERITIAFNYFNKNADGTSKSSLDINEQIAMLNFMHKADGEEKDGKVTRRSLNKAQDGVEGALKYKDYKAFMEAYENAIADSNASVKFDARNRSAEGTLVQNNGTATLYSADETAKELEKTVKGENGTQKFDQFGRLAMKKENGVTTQYLQYDSNKPDAKPTVIKVGNEQYTLDENGLYKNNANETFRINSNGTFEQVVFDENNRLQKEDFGNNTFEYRYIENGDKPWNITVTDENNNSTVYFQTDNNRYATDSGDNVKYYTFDSKTHTFTEDKTAQQKPTFESTGKKIHQNATWSNQRLGVQKANKLKLNELDNAQQVLEAIINADENLKNKNIDKETLLADFITNNPSLFVASGENEGKLYINARWAKLDFPHDLSTYYITES